MKVNVYKAQTPVISFNVCFYQWEIRVFQLLYNQLLFLNSFHKSVFGNYYITSCKYFVPARASSFLLNS